MPGLLELSNIYFERDTAKFKGWGVSLKNKLVTGVSSRPKFSKKKHKKEEAVLEKVGRVSGGRTICLGWCAIARLEIDEKNLDLRKLR